jgi:hypothetical protein
MATIPILLALMVGGTHILPSTNAESSFQICVNGKCEIVSDYEGYQNKNTCVNEDCTLDLPTNSSIYEVN